MNRKLSRVALLLIAWLSAPILCRAGMDIYDPDGGHTGGWFMINFGLGSPYPGKVAYVRVIEPNGSEYDAGSAENVPDKSQTAWVYASQAGTYQFFYEYSYEAAGVPRTTVYEEDHTVSEDTGSPPSISWTQLPSQRLSGQVT